MIGSLTENWSPNPRCLASLIQNLTRLEDSIRTQSRFVILGQNQNFPIRLAVRIRRAKLRINLLTLIFSFLHLLRRTMAGVESYGDGGKRRTLLSSI